MDINRILNKKEDKLNFLKGLIRIANSDGIKDNAEIIYYHQTAKALGLEEQELGVIDDVWRLDAKDITLTFSSNEVKMFFFVEAIQLCWIDDSYTSVEEKEIRAIANELNISEDAIKAVELWVEEGMAWNKRGDDLLELQ